MAKINNDSIKKKIESIIESKSFKQNHRPGLLPQDKEYLEQVIARLYHCYFKNVFNNPEINEGAASAIGELHSHIVSEANSKGEYIILCFVDDNARTSLVPERYEGIDDMAALFNKGYTANNQVFGIWHGQKVGSRMSRKGLHFVEQTVSDFNGNYGSDFNALAKLTPEGANRFT